MIDNDNAALEKDITVHWRFNKIRPFKSWNRTYHNIILSSGRWSQSTYELSIRTATNSRQSVSYQFPITLLQLAPNSSDCESNTNQTRRFWKTKRTELR
jgi:hypothetical protein